MKNISEVKRRRRFVVLVCFLLVFFLIIWNLFSKKNYTLEYSIDGFKIVEVFDKAQDNYYFRFQKANQEYAVVLPSTHFSSKKLVYQIEEFQDGDETCIKLYSNKLRFSPLCLRGTQQISYHLVHDAMSSKLEVVSEPYSETPKEYHNINVYNYMNHDYYIWNYRGFYHINESISEEIQLYDKDIYEPKLLSQVGDYLFVPDYNTDYSFDKVLLIHRKTGRQEVWNLDTPIFFDSLILGVYEDSIYLVDKHEKIEWKLTPSKKVQEKIGSEKTNGRTYQHGWQDVSITRLINQDYLFTGVFPISYELRDGLFAKFMEHSVLIREQKPTKIIAQVSDGVFFLENNILYAYFERYGEVQIMSSFEWNFNSNRIIFIF